MADPIPTDAEEAAVQAIRDSLQFPDSAPADAWPRIAKIALTAAAPLIAAQATADLRVGVEALRDEWRERADDPTTLLDCDSAVEIARCADALDALLRERAR